MEEYKGPLGFWNLPFLNKFRRPKYSIKDHKILAGAPNYISTYEIEVNYRDEIFTLEMQYDCKIKAKYYHAQTGDFMYETEADVPMGYIYTVSPDLLTRNGTYIAVLEQTWPR